jgi:hypothetical protein
MANALRCRCGHEADAHEHFRAGRDCGICTGCRRFTRAEPDTVVLAGVAWNRFRQVPVSHPPRTPVR